MPSPNSLSVRLVRLRWMAVPIAAYLVVALLLPMMNGAMLRGEFAYHAVWLIGGCVGIVALAVVGGLAVDLATLAIRRIRRRFAIAAAIAITALTIPDARADQCQWLLEPEVARRAIELLEVNREVVAFCELCGDTVPDPPYAVHTVAEVPKPDARAIAVNGEEIDLAYTYIRTSEHEYRNLAVLAGCDASGMSTTLRVDRETPSSVMITPAASSRVPEVAHVHAESTFVITWAEPVSAIWLFGFGALLAALAGLLVHRTRRRRAEHTPRAAQLGLPDR